MKNTHSHQSQKRSKFIFQFLPQNIQYGPKIESQQQNTESFAKKELKIAVEKKQSKKESQKNLKQLKFDVSKQTKQFEKLSFSPQKNKAVLQHELNIINNPKLGYLRGRELFGAVQSILKSLRFYQKNIDGFYGPGTKSALLKFQKQHNLVTTGTPNKATVITLLQSLNESKPKPTKEDTEKITNQIPEIKQKPEEIYEEEICQDEEPAINKKNNENKGEKFVEIPEKHRNFSNKNISNKSILDLSKNESLLNITSLNLSNNDFDGIHAIVLSKSKYAKNLKNLDLSNNIISKKEQIDILKNLPKCEISF